MSKRKVDAVEGGETGSSSRAKRASIETKKHDMLDRFGPGLFDTTTVQNYATSYATSEPYKHAVIPNLIDDTLLRSVRAEILDNIHFTPKETDIYKIHQSGDLANLDGLDPGALAKLPSLLQLRDALYGAQFRQWVQDVSGAGALSGRKTDMAVNVYVPGCHLLCHDDVIGSRRVSYILYLTDPDRPWKAEWGGALRLYSTERKEAAGGETYRVPLSEWSKVIPPAWNQLSFFAVQPGESFHDVEEVYHRAAEEEESEEDGGRFRMAISGWFHIPQDGEEGYEPGLEESMAKQSSLQQLQGKADQFDEPKPIWLDSARAHHPAPHNAPLNGAPSKRAKDHEDVLSEQEFDFLLQYMTPTYLTPDTVDELTELFAEESTLQLSNFLNRNFAARLREQFEQQQQVPSGGPGTIPSDQFSTSRPPYKHRYQYLQPTPASISNTSSEETNPYMLLLHSLLPSLAFRKWMEMVTGLGLERTAILARKFRRGMDYQLAQGFRGGEKEGEGQEGRVEYTMCVTPTGGWGGEEDGDGDGDGEGGERPREMSGEGRASEAQGNDQAQTATADEDNVGGYELYMAGDDDDDNDDNPTASDTESNDGVTIPPNIIAQSHTGAGDRRSAARSRRRNAAHHDPAVYQPRANGEGDADGEEDDGILFTNPASWNTLSIVLRDRGTLRFVKYVSRQARGDRWDVAGEYEVVGGEEEEVEEGE
ncbi:hypothetical protein B0A55_04358 [Friedmanniomyces simplex]|uniref:uS12 prolyl 3,4-dihydroxylase n=1 Tax=Friedmanniomyces simplex TaxID=329884 RepID=A0A4U0XQG3_9PEZI|nr:hypothetical protein B0A55_04358 [Friedmanniomyces simplex]